MRTAIAHRHAEALRGTDGDVGADSPGEQQGEGQQVGGDDRQRAFAAQGRDRGPQVADRTRCRILEQPPNTSAWQCRQGIADDDVQPSGSARVRSTAIVCGWQLAIDEEGVGLQGRDALGHCHGFRGSGGFIEQRGVGDVEPREVAIMVWKLNSASSRPWVISGWYGV